MRKLYFIFFTYLQICNNLLSIVYSRRARNLPSWSTLDKNKLDFLENETSYGNILFYIFDRFFRVLQNHPRIVDRTAVAGTPRTSKTKFIVQQPNVFVDCRLSAIVHKDMLREIDKRVCHLPLAIHRDGNVSFSCSFTSILSWCPRRRTFSWWNTRLLTLAWDERTRWDTCITQHDNCRFVA